MNEQKLSNKQKSNLKWFVKICIRKSTHLSHCNKLFLKLKLKRETNFLKNETSSF